MADKKDLPLEEEEDERNLNYNPPAQKSLQEIQELDKDDDSLVKYKQTLLGTGPVTAGVCAYDLPVVTKDLVMHFGTAALMAPFSHYNDLAHSLLQFVASVPTKTHTETHTQETCFPQHLSSSQASTDNFSRTALTPPQQ